MRHLFIATFLLGCSSAEPAKARDAPSRATALAAKAASGLDTQRRALPMTLTTVLDGVDQPTDIQAVPGAPVLIILQKTGQAIWFDPAKKTRGAWFDIKVNTRSEQGLLGLAFHPDFAKNGRLYLNYSLDVDGKRVTRIDAWKAGPDPRTSKPTRVGTVLEVEQPYPNHDAGQLVFGPDGMLYVGFGDGGAANDPHGHGQNRKTLLGNMLRLNVDGPLPYAVPKDNPFVGIADVRPEIWAYGLRNPWRYSFAPDGRLVVADVGQNIWEEITIVGRGENHGWAIREAHACFPASKACTAAGMVDPIYAYPRGDGNSVTGGFVYTGSAVPALKGKYVFADFGSGRFWALDLPPKALSAKGQTPRIPEAKAWSLGQFDLNPSTFGVGADGTLYVGDFRGQILAVTAP
ncbi:MAG: glucose/arabinose dehydrogenase [Bradymonadia bacterium]|jgi:glucose/arabinose dehydrogenase